MGSHCLDFASGSSSSVAPAASTTTCSHGGTCPSCVPEGAESVYVYSCVAAHPTEWIQDLRKKMDHQISKKKIPPSPPRLLGEGAYISTRRGPRFLFVAFWCEGTAQSDLEQRETDQHMPEGKLVLYPVRFANVVKAAFPFALR